MKIPHLLLAALMFFLVETASGETAQQVLNEAQRSYVAGDMAEAKRKFQIVLQLDSHNKTAISYLKMIAASEPKSNGGAALQKQLEKLILPKVEFRDATFGAALNYLKQLAAKQSEGKAQLSFVLKLPAEFADTEKVTLSLTNVPCTEALRYLGEVANVRFSYEKYAIVVAKKEAATPPPPAETPAPIPGL